MSITESCLSLWLTTVFISVLTVFLKQRPLSYCSVKLHPWSWSLVVAKNPLVFFIVGSLLTLMFGHQSSLGNYIVATWSITPQYFLLVTLGKATVFVGLRNGLSGESGSCEACPMTFVEVSQPPLHLLLKLVISASEIQSWIGANVPKSERIGLFSPLPRFKF